MLFENKKPSLVLLINTAKILGFSRVRNTLVAH